MTGGTLGGSISVTIEEIEDAIKALEETQR